MSYLLMMSCSKQFVAGLGLIQFALGKYSEEDSLPHFLSTVLLQFFTLSFQFIFQSNQSRLLSYPSRVKRDGRELICCVLCVCGVSLQVKRPLRVPLAPPIIGGVLLPSSICSWRQLLLPTTEESKRREGKKKESQGYIRLS